VKILECKLSRAKRTTLLAGWVFCAMFDFYHRPSSAFCRLPAIGFAVLLLFTTLNAQPVVRDITVVGNTRTRSDILVRELLFQSGESLDTLKIAETERNLRRLYFLGNIFIETVLDGSFADITVHVTDLYARAISPILGGNADELSYGFTALDYNLLGRGQIAQVTLAHDAVSGNRGRIFYRNPRINGSRLALTSDLGLADEGHHVALSLNQSFNTLATAWAYGLIVHTRENVQRLYRSGRLVEKYTDLTSGGSLWLTRSYGQSIKTRPGLQVSVTDQTFKAEPGYAYAPGSRRRILASFSLSLWKPHYEKQVFVRQLGRTEDLQTGSSVSTRIGVSTKALGSDDNYLFYALQIAPRFKPTPNSFVFANLSLGGRHQGGIYANLDLRADGSLYARFLQIHTLALRARYDALLRPEDNGQLLLGLFRGLRGYGPRRFDGSRRYTLNLEARPTLYRTGAFVVGGTVFVDAGDAWTPGQAGPAFNSSAGAGLRLATSHVYDQPILRSDLAYGFRDRSWQISLGLDHYF
jgi:outer membrane protein assembly factor BamA